jgi:hypothetical protein
MHSPLKLSDPVGGKLDDVMINLYHSSRSHSFLSLFMIQGYYVDCELLSPEEQRLLVNCTEGRIWLL